MKRESYISQQLPAVLSKLETLLKANKGGDGYFIGETVSSSSVKETCMYISNHSPNYKKKSESHVHILNTLFRQTPWRI